MKELFEYALKGRIIQELITLELKFLFEKVTWERKVFHILVSRFGTNY